MSNPEPKIPLTPTQHAARQHFLIGCCVAHKHLTGNEIHVSNANIYIPYADAYAGRVREPTVLRRRVLQFIQVLSPYAKGAGTRQFTVANPNDVVSMKPGTAREHDPVTELTLAPLGYTFTVLGHHDVIRETVARAVEEYENTEE